MPTDPKQYKTATSFRRALEDRLKNIAEKEAVPLDRMRRRVSFDRLLARLFGIPQSFRHHSSESRERIFCKNSFFTQGEIVKS
jgi:hypothetical protein